MGQYKLHLKRVGKEVKEDDATISLTQKYEQQLRQLDSVLTAVKDSVEQGHEKRFDYIFTNAPDNEHNRAKFDADMDDGNVVIDGKYNVDIKIATESVIDHTRRSEIAKGLLCKFSSSIIVAGGDACVPPNPMAAYGATLATEFADMLVQLAVSYGHINAILTELQGSEHQNLDQEWLNDVKDLKSMFTKYYNARAQAENYFQWVQTLICNLYSLPPMP